MISVGNSTMTITTLILLLATGIVAVTLVHGSSIKNCCNVATKHYYFSIDRKPSTVYNIVDLCGQGTTVQGYCDTITDGGGWLVVQRRGGRSVDFNSFWWQYEMGFGSLEYYDFWYGLRALHCLTGQGGWEMRMDITLANGTNIFLQYEQFKVASAKDRYKLTVGGFQGTTTDPMAYHNGMNFTTKDSDNDQWSGGNCAIDNHGHDKPSGGWWYNDCSSIQPNMHYNHGAVVLLNNKNHSLRFIQIKIRPHNCNI